MGLKVKAIEVNSFEDKDEIAKAKKVLGIEKGMPIDVGVTVDGRKKTRHFIIPAKSADEIRGEIEDDELISTYRKINYLTLLNKCRAELESKKSSSRRSSIVL